jgi:pyridinium-3,5-biscarboxylic acid mononucleotide sulfurtransferase
MQDGVEGMADHLVGVIRGYGSVAVAFSAGVDSTVVAKAAQLGCGEKAIAVTADSPSLADGELDQARDLAQLIGIVHRVVKTDEFSDPRYLGNPSNRCYYCKTELYSRIEQLGPELGVNVVCNGANLDDQRDHRPGMIAASEHQVRSPLIEAGLSKADVRELARHWQLPVWDKPAMPCLSSRIAYGVAVTPERIRRIDDAEQFLRSLLTECELRVRLEADDVARIEVPLHSLAKLVSPDARAAITARFRSLGFNRVTLDLEGFRTGSMNDLVPLESRISLIVQ